MDVSTARSVKPLLGILGGVADLFRLFALASVAVGSIVYGWGAGVSFVIIFLITLIPRLVGQPRWVDVAVDVTWLTSVWVNVVGLYQTTSWLDYPIHFFTVGVNAGALYLLLILVSLVPPLQHRRVRSAALVLITLALGALVGVLWEFYEWVAYDPNAYPNREVVGYTDTIADLLMDTTGSLAMGIGLAVWAVAGWDTRRTPLRVVGQP